MYRRIRDAIWHKQWTPQQIHSYVGDYREAYFTYATDPTLRERASSGGSVTALLSYLLETGQIDGALVCDTAIVEGRARPRFYIATDRIGLLRAQGSKYSAVYFASQALPLIKAFEGRLAVVALPCDAQVLARTRELQPEIDAKIACVIALFCGQNSEPELIDHVTERLGQGHGPLTDFVYRVGHWRGKLRATYADGTVIEKPGGYYRNYRNLYFFTQKKCHHCHDHFGYFCDLSAGDVWSPEMKAQPINHNALITRSARGQQIVEGALAAGYLTGGERPIEAVANGQARTLPFHYDVSARARVGRLFGLKIKDTVHAPFKWNHYVLAWIALFNEWASSTRLGRRLIFLVPRPLIRAYLFVFKILESF